MHTLDTYVRRDPGALTDPELLGVLLGLPLAEASTVAAALGPPARWADLAPADLMAAPHVGPKRALRLHAALRLARRALLAEHDLPEVVLDAGAAHAALAPGLAGLLHEELHALYLDRRHRVLAHRVLTRGSERFTVVDPPQIFRPAVRLAATGVVLGHNHPSGDPTPSTQDREVTRRCARAGRVLGITVVDHLVIARERWVSLRERGDLDDASPVAASWTACEVPTRP